MSSMSPEADEVTILETREASPSHFLLKVKSFSLLQKHGIHRYESREFNAGGYKWYSLSILFEAYDVVSCETRLILYPNEDKTGEDNKNYVSVYLAISEKISDVNAFFSIFVLNQILGNYQCSSGRTRHFMTVKSEWGISKFLSKKVLNDPSNGFLINDNGVFGAEVFIVRKGQNKKGRDPSFCKRLFDFAGVKDCFTVGHVKDRINYELEYYNKKVAPDATILETREASPTHFVMQIKSFLLRGKHGIYRNQRGDFDAEGYKWRLNICPNEEKMGTESKYISAYLAILNTKSLQTANWEVNAVFSIFLLNQISGKYHYALGGTRRFQATRSVWGISEFISKKVMMDPSNGFLINNNCVFGAEVFIIKDFAMSECLSIKSATIPYKSNWKISNFSKLGHNWTSEEFVVEGLKWNILMYPKGVNNEERHFQAIGIFLRLIDSKRVKASFSICIKDQINNEQEIITEASRWFSPTSDCWGWSRFMELSTLQDPVNGFIIKDCCHLEIEISVQAVV